MKKPRMIVVILPVVVLAVSVAAMVTSYCFTAFGNGYIGKMPDLPVYQETESSEEETETETESETETETEEETETESETETEEESYEETEPEPVPQARRIWVGDSRVVGITSSGIGDPAEDAFIGKNGRYFVWFNNDALPVLRNYLNTGKAYEVIIQIGINDCANKQMGLLPYFAEDYARLINSLIDQYPNARFWFLSVGEVIGVYGAGTRWEVQKEALNPLVAPFNATMKSECRANYLPVGELIKAGNKSYADGVHYSVETNQWIYDYVLECIAGSGENPGDKEYDDVWNNHYVPEPVAPAQQTQTEPESESETESGSEEESSKENSEPSSTEPEKSGEDPGDETGNSSVEADVSSSEEENPKENASESQDETT